MLVKVKLFASLTNFVAGARPGEPLPVELADGATVADLIAVLELPEEQVRLVFVNALFRSPTYVLHPADDVGIFPPIGGGLAV